MASSVASPCLSSSFLQTRALTVVGGRKQSLWMNQKFRTKKRDSSLLVRAAKLPEGVILPKVEPNFKPAFLGFTYTAETWNSRACMIGLIGTFIVELILNKGILQLIGIEIGKGLDLPL